LLSASLIAPYVAAQDAGPPSLAESLGESARADYESGKILYADGDYAGAVIKFQRAYEASGDPRLIWNQAVAEKNQRHYVRVAELIERYLVESGDRISVEERSDANRTLEAVLAFVTDVHFKVVPDGVAIFVDGQQVGTSPLSRPLRVDMGERRIRAQKPGYQPLSAVHQFKGGTEATVEINLQPEVRQGQLRVDASPWDTIRVDGRVVGTGAWRGTLRSGPHRVEVSAPGKRTYSTQIAINDDQVDTLRIVLEPLPHAPAGAIRPVKRDAGGDATLAWVTGSVLVLAGLSVGSYFLFTPEARR
jgi:hypothetical protein